MISTKKYLILPELTNKLLIKVACKREKKTIYLTNNFKLSDIKLIKNIIGFELISGVRPAIQASLLKKTMIINLRTIVRQEFLSFLQKSPVAWSKYLEPMTMDSGFFLAPVTVKNLKFNCQLNYQGKLSKLDTWIKSAYLD